MKALADHFAAISEGILGGRTDVSIQEAISAAETLAQQLSGSGGTQEARQLSANLVIALEAWRTVWPRMGTQREFRAAVAREAALWAKRLRSDGAGTVPQSQ
jgi:hypothetical protein